MTRTFIVNLFFGLLIFSSLTALATAQENPVAPLERSAILDERLTNVASRTEEREERREDIEAARASTTEAIRENIAERRGVLAERVVNRILALANNISEKMRAAIYRLTNISDRMEARLAIMETEGRDVATARAHIKEAREQLATAEAIIDTQTDALVDAAVGSPEPQARWNEARAAYQSAHQALRAARSALVAALQAMKNPTALPTDAGTTTDNQ